MSKTVIDLHAVHAEFVKNEEVSVKSADEEWLAKHVRHSQYFVQIMKSSDSSFCSVWRSKRKGTTVTEPKDHIKMENNKNLFAGLLTRLYLKMSPKSAVGMETSIPLFMIHSFIDNQLNISYQLFR